MNRRTPLPPLSRALLGMILILTSSIAMAIEQPSYRVLDKDGAFELRQYGPELVAETRVKADFDAAGGEAFRRLLRYISGYNRSQGKIPMTAPVTQVPAGGTAAGTGMGTGAGTGEAIPMTAPVDQVRDGDDYRVAFLMPAAYTEASLPVPLDPSIQIRRVPARLLATWTYSGRWTQTRYQEMERALRQTLLAHHLGCSRTSDLRALRRAVHTLAFSSQRGTHSG